ncbi:flavin reductase family protein [Pelagibacterium luteolum]|uniref:NADH-FMN oxidoreductase RutF, flavin reductase (DIM6/NTAB) family n=1 Tax=Pelagibacterium luteolum TaxID=440168 RepID=A0A1G8AB37_9HYPH|nr:flavin reductase family protein [Pelagibacterium luteolum]SDH18101.1 NADH-FMN oxidoreductase RutF, flavin reductase (DIM6/NTAB) family [Pelagibacterium luteolum]
MYYDPLKKDHGLAHDPFLALVSPRPIGWISSIGETGVVNLAPYSFFNAVSTRPPMVMFSSSQRKDSQHNAERSGEFVANMATYQLRDAVLASSANFASDQSEPAAIGLAMAPSISIRTPRVALSPVALECRYVSTISLTNADGAEIESQIILGQVVGIYIDDAAIVAGKVDLSRLQPLSRLGYLDYGTDRDIFSMGPA